MDYLDFALWKLLVFAGLAFVWGVYCGIKGWPLSGPPSQQQEQSGTAGAVRPGSTSLD